jgi:hypothetical protein
MLSEADVPLEYILAFRGNSVAIIKTILFLAITELFSI